MQFVKIVRNEATIYKQDDGKSIDIVEAGDAVRVATLLEVYTAKSLDAFLKDQKVTAIDTPQKPAIAAPQGMIKAK